MNFITDNHSQTYLTIIHKLQQMLLNFIPGLPIEQYEQII